MLDGFQGEIGLSKTSDILDNKLCALRF